MLILFRFIFRFSLSFRKLYIILQNTIPSSGPNSDMTRCIANSFSLFQSSQVTQTGPSPRLPLRLGGSMRIPGTWLRHTGFVPTGLQYAPVHRLSWARAFLLVISGLEPYVGSTSDERMILVPRCGVIFWTCARSTTSKLYHTHELLACDIRIKD